MKKVFIAGKYNDDNVIKVLANIRAGQQAAIKLMEAGFAPFCPFLDYQYGLQADLPKETYQAVSMAFVESCEIMLMLPSWPRSGGAKRELDRASAIGKTIYYDIDELIEVES